MVAPAEAAALIDRMQRIDHDKPTREFQPFGAAALAEAAEQFVFGQARQPLAGQPVHQREARGQLHAPLCRAFVTSERPTRGTVRTKAPVRSRSNMSRTLLTHSRRGRQMRTDDTAATETKSQRDEPAPASDHPGARYHADPGLGLELLSAGAARRSHGARSRRLLQLGLWRVLGLAGDLGDARPAHRAADRSVRRPAGAVGVEPDDRRRPRSARPLAIIGGDGDRLARARHRHGDGALRRRLRRARPHLRHRGAQADHRHHADGRLRLHRRLAAHRLGPVPYRLARDLLRLGGRQYPDRPAPELLHAAGDQGRQAGRGDGREAASAARPHHGAARLRLRGGLDRHRRDGRRISRACWRPQARRRSRRSRPAR